MTDGPQWISEGRGTEVDQSSVLIIFFQESFQKRAEYREAQRHLVVISNLSHFFSYILMPGTEVRVWF